MALALALANPHRTDIAMSTLTLYVGVNKAQLPSITTQRAIAPADVMQVTDQRAWVPLATTIDAALERAAWGAEEVGHEAGVAQLFVFAFEFTTLGFGHYTLNQQLTSRNGKQYRFHGNLPLGSTSTAGELLVYAKEAQPVHNF